MPINSFADLRTWLAPWVWAAVILTGMVFAFGQPPVDMWPEMLFTIVFVVVIAGCVAALLFSIASHLTKLPVGSHGSFVIAAVSGAAVPFFPIPVAIGGAAFSCVLFAVASVVAVWRLTPDEAVAPVQSASEMRVIPPSTG